MCVVSTVTRTFAISTQISTSPEPYILFCKKIHARKSYTPARTMNRTSHDSFCHQLRQLLPNLDTIQCNIIERQHTRELISARKASHKLMIQKQRPESPTVTLTWHASKYKIHQLHQKCILSKIHQRHIFNEDVSLVEFMYLVFTRMPSGLP